MDNTMARIVSVRAIFTLRTQKYTARESLKSTSNAQVLRLRAPHNHVISSVAQRRTFHSTRGCLLQDDIQGSARGTQSVGAKESPAITDEEAEQFAAGTHRWLQEPAQKMARGSLLVDKYRAPNLGFIKVITLNELRTFNALSRQMVSELREEVDSIHAEDSPGETRVLIIRSEAEKAFCAGANLKERANMTIEDANKFLHDLRETLHRLSTLPVPSISAIHGLALGGGLELALCTHLRVVSQNVNMGLPEANLGIIPGAGGTFRLPALIGVTRALELMLTTRRIGAVEALGYGLCNGIVEHEPPDARHAVLKQAMKLAANIALRAPLSVRAVIQATQNGGSPAAEGRAYESVIRTHDRNEALAAFKDKRPAHFSGK